MQQQRLEFFGFHSLQSVALTGFLAFWGLSGYTLKGIECALSKNSLTTLQAELYLIRLRQGGQDLIEATPEEREKVITAWNALQSSNEIIQEG